MVITKKEKDWLKSIIYKETVDAIHLTKRHFGTEFAENHYNRAKEMLELLKKLYK